MKQKKLLMLIAMVLVVVLCASVLTACKKDKGNDDENVTKPGTGWEDPKMYTMREYTSQMPSQWCVPCGAWTGRPRSLLFAENTVLRECGA